MRDLNRLQRETWKSDKDYVLEKIGNNEMETERNLAREHRDKQKYYDDISLKSNYSWYRGRPTNLQQETTK